MFGLRSGTDEGVAEGGAMWPWTRPTGRLLSSEGQLVTNTILFLLTSAQDVN